MEHKHQYAVTTMCRVLGLSTSSNSRNGHDSKTIIVDQYLFEIRPPRDCNGSFEEQLIPKCQIRLNGFDEKILAMYA